MNWRILEGDALKRLRELDAGSVQTCITSPPYFGLRDYGHNGQIGLEASPDEYVAALVEVFGEVRRVLRDDGTLWLNLGDSYASAGGEREYGNADNGTGRGDAPGPRIAVAGVKPKDLLGIPWMVAFALRADGWYLRSEVIWAKPNPMPESVTDRPTKAHEQVFLLSKSARYVYDAEAIAEPSVIGEGAVRNIGPSIKGAASTRNDGDRFGVVNNGTRNKRSVWTVSTKPYAEAHFATFPPDLVEPMVLAGCPIDGTLLDPFAGAGTTGLVALRHQRSFIGIELNGGYCELARNRIRDDGPLFNVAGEVAA